MTEAIGRRVDAYLVKPTSPRQVLSVVTRILEGSAIRQQQAAQDFAARFSKLVLLRQEARSSSDFASLYDELVDWHMRLEAAGESGLLDTVGSLMVELMLILHKTAVRLFRNLERFSKTCLPICTLQLWRAKRIISLSKPSKMEKKSPFVSNLYWVSKVQLPVFPSSP